MKTINTKQTLLTIFFLASIFIGFGQSRTVKQMEPEIKLTPRQINEANGYVWDSINKIWNIGPNYALIHQYDRPDPYISSDKSIAQQELEIRLKSLEELKYDNLDLMLNQLQLQRQMYNQQLINYYYDKSRYYHTQMKQLQSK